MPILVTGASGFIGRHLTAALLARGAPVRVVTRGAARLPAEWSGKVEVVAGSLTDKATLESAAKGAALVFHLAGETQETASMQAVNADAARELVRVACAVGVGRFVHLSSVGVIGANQAGDVTEDAPCRPKNEYERTKLDGERAVLEFARANGFAAAVIRPTIVFGEGVTRSRDSLLEWMRALQQGRFAFIGRKAVANYVYVGDVVEALLKLGERPSPGGEIFHVADPAPMRDFVGAMSDALGIERPTGTIPTWAAYAGAAGLETANRLFGTPAPLTFARVRALSSACRFTGDKLRTRVGGTLPFGYRAGLDRTVQWYRKTGSYEQACCRMTILEMSTESSVQMAFIVPLAQHLRKQGHQVVLACSDDPGEAGQSFVETLRRMGFEVLVIPMQRTIAPWADLRATVELYRHLRRRRFDVVHTQTAKAGIIGRIAAFLARVPVIVYTAHAFPFHEYLSPWRIELYVLLERLASLLCHAIAVDSECVRSRGLAFHVAPPEKIRVIPMGIDTERFDPGKYRAEREAIRGELGLKPSAAVIGAVARFVPDKGLDVLLQAVGLLAKRFPDMQCLLAGDGPLREDLRTLSRALGLEGRIVFAGYRTDIPRVLSAMDIYMLPTRREGFGVAFAEAMSMEVPVIASRIAPLDEIVVDGQSGALAEVGNAEAFARAAEPLLADPDLRRRMGQAARRRILDRFEQSLMCKAYERLFLECTAR